MKDSDRNRAVIAEVIARVWREPAFREQLKKNPKQTLTQAGMTIAASLEVVLLENTPTIIHAVLPPKADMQRYEQRMQKAVAMLSDMPDNLEVRVYRDSATRSYLVIPAMPPQVKPGELSDAQLEQVAGGKHHHRDVFTLTSAVTSFEAVASMVVAAHAEIAVAAIVAPCFVS